MSAKYETREQWLTALTEQLRPMFRKAGYTIPARLRVSCGWPATGGTRAKNRTVGQCFTSGDAEGVKQIFIHPQLANPVEVAAVHVHEVGHACLPVGAGHKKPFSQFCKAIGLEGKPTATHAGETLTTKLKAITDELGPYPHAVLDYTGPKQKTKLLAVRCTQCDCVVRMTQKWLDEVGAPTCGCGAPMQQQDKPDENAIKLRSIEQMVEYRTPDDRFTIRFLKHPTQGNIWYLVDHEHGHKLTRCDDKQDCFDTIDAIREGVYLYEEDFETDWEVDEFELNHAPMFEALDLPHHLNDWEVEDHDVPEDNEPADPFDFERERGITEGAWASSRDPYTEDEPASILPVSYPQPKPETVAIFGAEALRA